VPSSNVGNEMLISFRWQGKRGWSSERDVKCSRFISLRELLLVARSSLSITLTGVGGSDGDGVGRLVGFGVGTYGQEQKVTYSLETRNN